MLVGQLNATTGELADIGDRVAGPNDVPLASMPAFFGPYGYDSVNRVAVALPRASQTDQQRCASVPFDNRLLAALALRLSASWATAPAAIQTRATTIINNAGAAVLNALT